MSDQLLINFTSFSYVISSTKGITRNFIDQGCRVNPLEQKVSLGSKDILCTAGWYWCTRASIKKLIITKSNVKPAVPTPKSLAYDYARRSTISNAEFNYYLEEQIKKITFECCIKWKPFLAVVISNSPANHSFLLQQTVAFEEQHFFS